MLGRLAEVAEIELLHNWHSWPKPTKPKISRKDMRLAPHRLHLAAPKIQKFHLVLGA